MYDESLSVDLRVMAEAVLQRVTRSAEAKRMVETHDNVMGGTPCFKGTQIPVHDIAAMLVNGDSVASVQVAYPRFDGSTDQRCVNIRRSLSAPGTAAQRLRRVSCESVIRTCFLTSKASSPRDPTHGTFCTLAV